MKLTENLVTIRLKLKNTPGILGVAITTIGRFGGNMGNIQIVKVEKEFKVRDLAVYVSTDKQLKDILSALSAIGKEIVEVVSVKDKVFELHEKGKIFLNNRISISTFEDLSRVYTPGVAKVCMAIHAYLLWQIPPRRSSLILLKVLRELSLRAGQIIITRSTMYFVSRGFSGGL